MVAKLTLSGRYAAYLRKSRADMEAEARGEEDTYTRHKRILFDLQKRLGITIAEIYQEEPMSGERISERPKMIKLLEDVESQLWDGILVVEVERLARGDTMDQGIVAQAFKYSNTLIITPMRTYDPTNSDDEEYFEFGLFMSRREFKTTTRRLQRGRITSVEEGKFAGNVAPYGYNRKKLDGKGWTLEPNPDEAPIVQLIFAIYTDPDPKKRMGTARICDYLNNVVKIPTRKGGEWLVATVRDILKNPHYIGMVRWKHRPVVKKRTGSSRPRATEGTEILKKGLHPALVEKDIFNRAESIMKGNTHHRSIDGKVKNPLAGLIRCGICGKAMIQRPYKGRTPDALICSKQYCETKSSYVHLVEEKLVIALKDWLKEYKAQWEKGKSSGIKTDEIKIKSLQSSLEGLKKQLDKLNTQRSNLHDLLEQGVYSVEVFMQRSVELKEKYDLTEKSIEDLTEELKTEEKRITAKFEIIPKLKEVIALYPKAKNPGQKNALLKSVIETVTYNKDNGGRWSGAQDQFTLVVYPKLPQ
ncbi:recombinase family protein [Paenibacillus sp. GXUN7292]|uniref:recombinase family protein n=1 Tax=Paenibacillus sp. GXUN7292 TaxID=3422499 RepID=UPI003D7CC09B